MEMTNILTHKLKGRVAANYKRDALDAFARIQPLLCKELLNISKESSTLAELTQRCDFTPSDLIRYRLTKKFEEPNNTHAATRKIESIRAMLDYDANGMIDFNPARMEIDPCVRHTLYNARLSLKEFYKTFKYDWSLVGFPSGESYDSSNGDNSLVAKLRNLENWKITPSCFELFCRIAYNTLWLKRSAKAHFRDYSREENRALFLANKRNPFSCFKAKLREIVTFWYGTRLTTVPKNNKTDRVIQVGCMLNMIVQLTIAKNHRRHIRDHFGIDLDHSHEIHKAMISDLQNATIDWSNASNSNWKAYIKWFLDENSTWHYLNAAREGVVSYEDEMFELNMLSPMGCGFTFEIMTLTLLVIARELDSFAHVYGDDVIIDRDCAEHYIQCVTFLGWKINEEKTFIDGPFRESCGAFYHSSYGYLTSFDFEWPSDALDVTVLLNKIFILIDYADPQLRATLKHIHAECIRQLPAFCLRPRHVVPCYSFSLNDHGLDRGVMVSKNMYNKLIQRNVPSRVLREISQSIIQPISEDYHYHRINVIFYATRRSTSYRHLPIDNVRSKHWIAHLFWNGTLSRPTRGQPKAHSAWGLLLM